MFTFFILFLFILFPFTNAQENFLKIGQVPPKLDFKEAGTLNPENYNTDFKNTVFIIDFWATWCSPCIESIPHMNEIEQKFSGRKVKFISITYEPDSVVKSFLKDHSMKSEIGLDNDFKLFRSYNAWAIPNVVMINSKGIIAGRVPSK